MCGSASLRKRSVFSGVVVAEDPRLFTWQKASPEDCDTGSAANQAHIPQLLDSELVSTRKGRLQGPPSSAFRAPSSLPAPNLRTGRPKIQRLRRVPMPPDDGGGALARRGTRHASFAVGVEVLQQRHEVRWPWQKDAGSPRFAVAPRTHANSAPQSAVASSAPHMDGQFLRSFLSAQLHGPQGFLRVRSFMLSQRANSSRPSKHCGPWKFTVLFNPK